MSISGSSVNSVLRLREVHRDQCHQQWAKACETEAIEEGSLTVLKSRLEQLRAELRDAVTPGTVDLENLLALKGMERLLRQQILACQQRCRQATQRSEQYQVDLAEADRQFRLIEGLADRRNQQQQQELAGKESCELGDLATRTAAAP